MNLLSTREITVWKKSQQEGIKREVLWEQRATAVLKAKTLNSELLKPLVMWSGSVYVGTVLLMMHSWSAFSLSWFVYCTFVSDILIYEDTFGRRLSFHKALEAS